MKSPRHFPAALSLAASFALAVVCARVCVRAQGTTERASRDVTAQPEREATGATGAITGRVLDESGAPVPGAIVSAFSGRTLGQPATSAVTDEMGNFILEGLEPGLYRVVPQARGYVLARDPSGATNSRVTNVRVGDTVQINVARGGVITGRVTDVAGEPVVAAGVRAVFVRNLEDPPGTAGLAASNATEFQTDDRGVYRIYGLPPGVYVVSAGGSTPFRRSPFDPFESEVATYYPSTTRDAAAELVVRTGEEAPGIDIRYRGEQGHAVSGRVEGFTESDAFQAAASAVLVHTASGAVQAQAPVWGRDGNAFIIEGVPDGDYELTVRRFSHGGDAWASAPQKVAVRGADVTGLRLTLAPLASLSGKLVLEPLPPAELEANPCPDTRALLPEEADVVARRDAGDAPKVQTGTRFTARTATAGVEPGGAFTIRGLEAGRYHLSARPASEDWYVRSVTTSAPAAPRRQTTQRTPAATPTPETPARESVQLASGQQATGATIRLAQGAASLRGRVVATASADASQPTEQPSQQTSSLPARVKLHLVPAERERADDPLFFYETTAAPDGSFAFTNVAPGRYHLLARDASQAPPDSAAQPAAWDTAARAALRREAEQSPSPVELKTCQRLNDYAVQLPK